MITYARSVVDHTKVTEDELNDAINRYLGGNVPIDQVIEYKKKLIELLKTNVITAVGFKIPDTANDNELIPLMANIPVDTKKAADFANNPKITDSYRYVAELLKEQG